MEIGVLVALEQIKMDAESLHTGSVAIGPFASLDANAVAARDGKTRGVIANLFGSQAAFQAETMALALSAEELIEQIVYPRPEDYPSADEWVDAFFAAQSARGPRHGAEPVDDYASNWALWLSAVPYGLWSEEVAGPSLQENRGLDGGAGDPVPGGDGPLRPDLAARHDPRRPHGCHCGPGRGALAQPVPDDPPPERSDRADRHGDVPLWPLAVAGRDTPRT